MRLIKTLNQAIKMDREKFKVPKSVQQAIPIRRIWPDGVFQVEHKFSKTFRFSDINYAIASKSDKTEMFLDYSELLNALDSGTSAKITLNNRRINKEEFEQSLLIPMKQDGLDEYRREYNEMLLSKVSGTNNSIYQERYLTISVHKKNIDEARTYFARVGTDIITHLAKLSSVGEELDAGERLQIFRDFFKAAEPASVPFDLKAFARKGHSFKDWICPSCMEFSKDCFQIDGRYGRVLYMQDYASYVKDDMVSELCDLSRDLMLSIDILPVPTDEAVREIQNRLLGVETNVTNWQRRQNANNNFSAVVPYDMELQRKETKEMLDDLTTRDQRMMFGLLTLVHMADTKEQLDSDTDTLLSTARKHLCQLSTLKWQQVDGLNTVLPYGLRKINALRTLTTESTAVLIPFHTQEIMQPGGIYYGQNAVSKNMLVADRRKLLNGNSFRLGVSGSGKSFSAKEEIVDLALSTEDDILILDPESEFTSLVEALQGEVIRISATSDTHLNALDMDAAYGDDKNPLIEKSEFILSLFEQLVGAGNLSAKEKSILDRCTADVYRDYIRNGYKGEVPTLKDLYRQLMLQPEDEARGLALSSELFINGSLNTFAQRTNVNTKSRIIDYDIRELGEQLMPLGMLVTLDSIFNRVIQNWRQGKTTWIFADEFYLLFRYQYSADFFYRLYKRIRKYYGFVTGLTQNVEELLKSDTARLMLANSEFLILLNQASTDREELAKILNISDNQLSYITNVSAGHGLIRCSGNIVPFENTWPCSTRLYQLMSTAPGDKPGTGKG
ncbi:MULTISPECIES: VirB4-like conjugal transfer ATPase, CD1110 family [Clostridia]|uniref:VirB4-like conjugal transfer ATPase, CD1110 family n=1 Tax=Clostridia TaxID=186801 RepID=UPI00067F37EC|nr:MULTISPECIES: TraE family protein [Clostridia]